MITHKNQLLVIISLISTPLIAKDFVDDFFDAEKEVMESARTKTKGIMKQVEEGVNKTQEGLQKVGEEIKKAGKNAKEAIVSTFESKLHAGIQENDTDNTVVVTITGIKADKIDATINNQNDALNITADSAEIAVYAKDRFLTVSIRQQIKTDNKNVKGVSYSSMQESRTIGGNVQLDKQTINYDQAKAELTITLPKAEIKKTGKPVTVNIIGKQAETTTPKSTDQTTETSTAAKTPAQEEPAKVTETTK